MSWHGVRISKYDPAKRDRRGIYTEHDWTSVSDIGERFDDGLLTLSRYVDVESRHVQAVASFVEEAGVDQLQVHGVERVPEWAAGLAGFAEGDHVDALAALDRVRLLLREELSCRLESEGFYCHVGYDYYLYVGTSAACPASVALTRRLGLFVDENFPSPQLDVD